MLWTEKYKTNKTAVWIKGLLSNGENIFLDSFKDIPQTFDELENKGLFFQTLSLQYKSHEVKLDVTNCDGVYLVKSVIGQFGGETKNTITFGKVIDNEVHKQIYYAPELILETEYVDKLSNCFEEAIVYDKTKNR